MTINEVPKFEYRKIEPYLLRFAIPGKIIKLEHLVQGLLHDTYIGYWQIEGGESIPQKKFIHQRINPVAFPDTKRMLDNVVKVVDFLYNHKKNPFPSKIELVLTADGDSYLEMDGEWWRTYVFVEESESHDVCPSSSHAEAFGRASARFIALLSDFPQSELHVHSPGFQDTEKRVNDLRAGWEKASSDRKHEAKDLYELVLSKREECSKISRALQEGELPVRTIHYDTKINNFLFRKGTAEVVCMIDLDLCMPGTALYDFGDLVRSASLPSYENGPDPDQNTCKLNLDFIEGVTRGFFSEKELTLTESERKLLPMAPASISYNLTARFLTDFLLGDRYFRVSRPLHNLERARVQWEVTQQLEGYSELISDICS